MKHWSEFGFRDWFRITFGLGLGLSLSFLIARLLGCLVVAVVLLATVAGLVVLAVWALPELDRKLRESEAAATAREAPAPQKGLPAPPARR